MENTEKRIVDAFAKAVDSADSLSWLRRTDILLRFRKDGKENHVEAEDIVYEIITKTIEGQRKWDIDNVPLNNYMNTQIWSEVANIRKRECKSTRVCFNDTDPGTAAEEAFNINSTERNDICDEFDWNNFLAECFRVNTGDGECQKCLEYLLEGRSLPDIFTFLGVEEEKGRNIYKRLKRRLKRHFKVP